MLTSALSVMLAWFLAFPQAPASPAPAFDLAGLIQRVSKNESRFREARDHYTYRQTFEFIEDGGGLYKAVTDVIFTPEGKRIEKPLKKPINTLKKLTLTDEDFRDLIEVQPFILDPDSAWNYEVKYVADQMLGNRLTHMLRARPKQTFEGQRLFDGTLWISADDLQIIQAEGRAVPDLIHNGKENLFPRFTTVRERIDGQNWFPVRTFADDVLQFRTGPIRVHFSIKYEQYKRFSAESKIQYDPK